MLALCGLLSIAACGEEDEGIETETGDIIRATSNGGRDQVVMLYGVLFSGGTIICSGSYYAPRVVVTAAHCIHPAPLSAVRLLRRQLRAGQGLADAVGVRSHPAADRHPVALGPGGLVAGAPGLQRRAQLGGHGRRLPRSQAAVRSAAALPQPGERQRAGDDHRLGLQFGADADHRRRLSACSARGAPSPWARRPPPTTTRTIRTPACSTRRCARRSSRPNGVAPNSSGCFGDSGGPIILNQWGQDYVAGVGYWTGLSCEDYNLFVRLDRVPAVPRPVVQARRSGRAEADVQLRDAESAGVADRDLRLPERQRRRDLDPVRHQERVGARHRQPPPDALRSRPCARLRSASTSRSGQTRQLDAGARQQPDRHGDRDVDLAPLHRRAGGRQRLRAAVPRAAALGLPARRRVRQLRSVLRRDRSPRRRLRPRLQRQAGRLAELRRRHGAGRRQLDLLRDRLSGILGEVPRRWAAPASRRPTSTASTTGTSSPIGVARPARGAKASSGRSARRSPGGRRAGRPFFFSAC